MTDIPIDTLPMEDYKAARESGAGAGAKVSTADLKENDPETPTGRENFEKYKERREKSKGGFQARIDRLIKQQAATEERAAAAEKRAAELEARQNGNGNTSESSAGKEGAATETEREEPAARRAPSDPREIAARERFPDWEKVMQSARNVRVADEASRELHESPLAAHVSYLIAKTPELGSELAKLPPAQQVEEIRRMEGEVADREPGSSALAGRILKESSPEEIKSLKEAGSRNVHLLRAVILNAQELADLSNGPAVYAALARDPELAKHIAGLGKSKGAVALGRLSAALEHQAERRSQVPAPIRPVTGGSTRSTIQLDKTDMATYKKLRSQGRTR